MPEDWHFTDVWGLDPEVLGFVQGPVKAVLLLYPISKKVQIPHCILTILSRATFFSQCPLLPSLKFSIVP